MSKDKKYSIRIRIPIQDQSPFCMSVIEYHKDTFNTRKEAEIFIKREFKTNEYGYSRNNHYEVWESIECPQYIE